MAKFNYKKWVLENKYGKSPLNNLTTQPEEEEFDDQSAEYWIGKKGAAWIEEDPKNPMGIPEIEKDPDAQAAAPKGGEGEKEEKPPLDAAAITNQTSYGELSGVEDAKKILTQLQSRDPNQPIYKAMTFTDKGKTVKPDPEKIANWVDGIGVDVLAQRMVDLGNALPSTGLPKKDMPFLPLPNDPKSKGDPADVGDAINPGGKYNVDFKEVYDFLNEKTDPPAPNTFVGMDDPAAQAYMKSGEKDGDPKDDKAAFNLEPEFAASSAIPTQSNILIAKSIGMAANGVKGGDLGAYFSTDNEILDGHHRWAATMLNDPGASIGGIAAIDLKAMGGTKQALKHLTAIGNALGNATKTAESIDPRSSLYERMEKLINK